MFRDLKRGGAKKSHPYDENIFYCSLLNTLPVDLPCHIFFSRGFFFFCTVPRANEITPPKAETVSRHTPSMSVCSFFHSFFIFFWGRQTLPKICTFFCQLSCRCVLYVFIVPIMLFGVRGEDFFDEEKTKGEKNTHTQTPPSHNVLCQYQQREFAEKKGGFLSYPFPSHAYLFSHNQQILNSLEKLPEGNTPPPLFFCNNGDLQWEGKGAQDSGQEA